jgi:hypothetical protein
VGIAIGDGDDVGVSDKVGLGSDGVNVGDGDAVWVGTVGDGVSEFPQPAKTEPIITMDRITTRVLEMKC